MKRKNTVVAYLVEKWTRTRQEKGGHACRLKTLQVKATEKCAEYGISHTFSCLSTSFHLLVDKKLIGYVEARVDSEVDLELNFSSLLLFMI